MGRNIGRTYNTDWVERLLCGTTLSTIPTARPKVCAVANKGWVGQNTACCQCRPDNEFGKQVKPADRYGRTVKGLPGDVESGPYVLLCVGWCYLPHRSKFKFLVP